MSWTFDPAAFTLPQRIAQAAQVTSADKLYVGQAYRTMVVQDTLDGKDRNGQAFAPYSTNGPYYYYPTGKVNRASLTTKQRKGQVGRFLKKIQPVIDFYFENDTPHGGELFPVKTRSGVGIRFESYADFKLSLGRTNVDLTGPTAPHMLQSLVVREEGEGVLVGFYGEEAARAKGHDHGIARRGAHSRRSDKKSFKGGGGLPKRQFFTPVEKDLDMLRGFLAQRIGKRIDRILNTK